METVEAINFLKNLGYPERKIHREIRKIADFWEKHVRPELRSKLVED